jgi:hypothetical protein
VSTLVDTLAAELERPRELSSRVLSYIGGHYEIDDTAVGDFLVNRLPTLEEYEVDLILSPVFTPKLADQTAFAELLGGESVPRQRWPALVQELVARPIRAQLITPDGRTHSVTLHEVTIERFVYRLRLDGSISESLAKLIDRVTPESDRPMLNAVARQAVWESAGAQGILARYLTLAVDREKYSLADGIDLLNLVEARKPANMDDLLARIPSWREALRQQIEVAGGPKPFFNEDVRFLHGGGRDQRQQEDSRVSAKQREFEFLGLLQEIFTP